MTDWAAEYRAHYTQLVRFLYRKVWDAERAHDLVQDTFARALNQTNVQNPKAWLFRVASNLAKDEARRAIRERKHQTTLQQDADDAQSNMARPGASVEHEERLGAVRDALAELSERDREILLLWSDGLSYPEISTATGLAVGAIGTTLSRARRRLVEAHRALEKGHAAR